jgi:hypothetical protein
MAKYRPSRIRFSAMALKRWEIQLLVLVAKNRKDAKARALVGEFPQLSKDAKEMANRILDERTNAGDRFDDTVKVFIKRADARKASRATREQSLTELESVA